MELQSYYTILLSVSLALLLMQLTVKNKQTVHIVFALFCGSIVMMTAKKISADSLGPYQYLLSFGACATCNVYWLVARGLFREHFALSLRHVLVAVMGAFFYLFHQGYLFFESLTLVNFSHLAFVDDAMGNLGGLLSSSLIVLAFWEVSKGFAQSKGKDRAQRLAFLSIYACAVVVSIVATSNGSNGVGAFALQEWVNTTAALVILLMTQVLIYLRIPNKVSQDRVQQATGQEKGQIFPIKVDQANEEVVIGAADLDLEQAIKDILFKQKAFLKANLKVADLARELEIPEYRVSRVLHQQFDARNFNHFINTLRIKHAKSLLEDPSKHHWPVLVVGLESGFASVGPFTRAFKVFSGYTPNQYRQINADSGNSN